MTWKAVVGVCGVVVVGVIAYHLFGVEGVVTSAGASLFALLFGRSTPTGSNNQLIQSAQDAAIVEVQNDKRSVVARLRADGYRVREVAELPEDVRKALERTGAGRRYPTSTRTKP
jgi:hypothetical protein